VKLARTRKPKAAYFLSCESINPIQIRAISHIEKYVQNMYPNVGMVKETKGGGNKRKEDSE
jgi:hypothetical protein